MAIGSIDYNGPVLANTFYCDNQLVAKDCTIELPEITFMTAELLAAGTFEIPIPSMLEAMELKITKIGEDKGLTAMCVPGTRAKKLEARWADDVVKTDASSTVRGGRAYFSALPKTFPGITLEPGEKSENEITFAVSRYQLVVGGQELLLIDRLNQIVRIKGENFYDRIKPLL